MQFHARRDQNLAVDRLDLFHNCVLDGDDIGASLTADGEEDAGSFIQKSARIDLKMAKPHLGHVFELNDVVASTRDDQLLQVFGIVEASNRP